jgi:O-antigen/teichoic acid export membrane protein
MKWSDYEAVWKRQEPPLGAKADVGMLKATFETRRRKLHAAIRVRDFAEAAASVFVAVVLAFVWLKMGTRGWPIFFAIVIVLGIAAVFIRERWRSRHRETGPDESLLVKVEADLAELRHQRHLVLTLWSWYLGPCAAAIVVVGLTLALSRPPGDIARDPLFLGGIAVFNAILFAFAWAINRRALRTRLEPRIEELEKLRRELLSARAPTAPSA